MFFVCFWIVRGHKTDHMKNYRLARLNDRKSDLSKTWYVYYSVIHPETKKFVLFQQYISSRLKTKKARYQKADEIMDQINPKLARGWNPLSKENPSFMTLEEAVYKFLEIKKTEIRKRTFFTYHSIINLFLTWCHSKKLDYKPLEQFTYQNAVEFLDYLKTEKKLTNKSHNNYRRAMNTVFIWFHTREYIIFNPWKRTAKLNEEQPAIIAFTEEELQIIKERLPEYHPRLWMVAQLIFYCFLRPQEIVRLRFSDINIKTGKIQISGAQSKNRNSQVLVMPAAFVDQVNLQSWEGQPDQYIFSMKLNPGKKLINPNLISKIWLQFCKENGLAKPIYGLKHTGVGMAFDNGINPRDLQIHIRHASLDETMKYLNRFRTVVSDNFRNNFPQF